MRQPHHFRNAAEALFSHIRFNPFNDFRRNIGIDEKRGADGDGGGAGEDEFERVGGGEDAAHADYGDGDLLIGLPDHAHGDGFDGWAGESVT